MASVRGLVGAAALALAAAGLGAQPARADSPAPVAEEPARDGLHDYVFGRFAFTSNALRDAAGYFADALAQAPGDPLLTRRAFDLAILAGDEELAVRLAPSLERAERYDSSLSLLRVTTAIKERDWKAAEAARARLVEAGHGSFLTPVIEAWTLFGRGKKRDALNLLQPEAVEGFARAYVAEHRAHLLAAARRYDEAAAAYQSLLAATEGGGLPRLRLAAASALQAEGEEEAAAAVLDAGGSDPSLDRARARLAAGEKIGGLVRTPAEGVAALFWRMSTDLSRDRAGAMAVVLARLATFLAPERPEPWLVVADLLARGGKGEAALAALDHIPPESLYGSRALALRAELLEELGEREQALALFRQQVASPNASGEDWLRYGELLRREERFAEAAAAYGEAIARARAGGSERWYLYFVRGSAYEQAGDWPRAEADLRQALALAPTEAVVLNYLGYGLLDRGLNGAEAHALIEQAARLRPDDGHIIDSLGWAHYRAGRYAQAVPALERAVADVPADPTINEHLGDAYWRVGRRLEARYRWRAALDGDPTPEQRDRLAAKLDRGLDVWEAKARGAPPAAR